MGSSDQKIAEIADRIGSVFRTPVGQIPFERLVRRCVCDFGLLRGAGLTWLQISLLLKREGVCRPDGKSFPPAHVRGVFGRVTRPVGSSTEIEKTLPPALQPHSSPAAPFPNNADIISRPVQPPSTPSPASSPHLAHAASDDRPKARVLEFMRQSSDARRGR